MYFLTPREATATTAILGVVAVDEAAGTALTVGPGAASPALSVYPTGRPRVQYGEVTIDGLKPREKREFTLLADAKPVAQCRVTTLPAEVPTLGDKPFTVLLGSCFAYHEDKQLKVGRAFANLPYMAQPDVKIFAGDQVYLDSPWYKYLVPQTEAELQYAFIEHYKNTWNQTEGFAKMLRDGANFFCSDDHEYWNNAPNFGTTWANTWTAAGRRTWMTNATQLYRAFQTPRPMIQFNVSPLSFLIADTRIHRDDQRENFLDPDDLEEVRSWVDALRGPGALIVGQPLLQSPTGRIKGTFGDWNLPDYKQYSAFADIIGSSKQAILLLTGDVHFGRVARSTMRYGAELIEIISSPMSLVDRAAEGEWTDAPQTFPAARPDSATPAMLARSAVTTEHGFAPTQGHFLTLEFTRRGDGANLRVRYWPTFETTPPAEFGRAVFERTLR